MLSSMCFVLKEIIIASGSGTDSFLKKCYIILIQRRANNVNNFACLYKHESEPSRVSRAELLKVGYKSIHEDTRTTATADFCKHD